MLIQGTGFHIESLHMCSRAGTELQCRYIGLPTGKQHQSPAERRKTDTPVPEICFALGSVQKLFDDTGGTAT